MKCYDETWNSWLKLAAPACVVFVVGVPFGFYWMVRRFKRRGRLNDEDVVRMIGWMYHPFREGCEYWLAVEQVRKLVLTAAIGFMARSCHYKPVEILQNTFSDRARCIAQLCRILIPA